MQFNPYLSGELKTSCHQFDMVKKAKKKQFGICIKITSFFFWFVFSLMCNDFAMKVWLMLQSNKSNEFHKCKVNNTNLSSPLGPCNTMLKLSLVCITILCTCITVHLTHKRNWRSWFYNQGHVIDYAIQVFPLEKYIWLMCDYGLCDNCFQICRLGTWCKTLRWST